MFAQIRHRSPYEEIRALLVAYVRGGNKGKRAVEELMLSFTPYELIRFAEHANGDNQVDAILRVAAKRVARM